MKQGDRPGRLDRSLAGGDFLRGRFPCGPALDEERSFLDCPPLSDGPETFVIVCPLDPSHPPPPQPPRRWGAPSPPHPGREGAPQPHAPPPVRAGARTSPPHRLRARP